MFCALRYGLRLQLLLLGVWLLLPVTSLGHEIPADVRVQVYVAEEDDALMVLLRVPLQAMRDIDFALQGPGYLDLAVAETQLPEAVTLWLRGELKFDLDGDPVAAPTLLAARLALPNDSSFSSYPSARRAIVEERIAPETQLYWEQALLDVALRYPLAGKSGELFVTPTFARLGLRTVTELRYLVPGEELRSFVFTGDPGRVALTPGIASVFAHFLAEGFQHVLDGLDHLLFLAALILPVRRLRPLIVIVTAFTLAHSITLTAAVFGLVPEGLWFPPFIEMLVAASIVVMALENIVQPALRSRWLIAYGFGLAHGFAFSFALTDMLQFSGDHLSTSLLAFNLGIEAGQILVLLLVFPLLQWLLRRLPRQPTLIVLSALIAHTAWHWSAERFEALRLYNFSLPDFDIVFFSEASRWLLLLLVALLVAWVMHNLMRRLMVGVDGRR